MELFKELITTLKKDLMKKILNEGYDYIASIANTTARVKLKRK